MQAEEESWLASLLQKRASGPIILNCASNMNHRQHAAVVKKQMPTGMSIQKCQLGAVQALPSSLGLARPRQESGALVWALPSSKNLSPPGSRGLLPAVGAVWHGPAGLSHPGSRARGRAGLQAVTPAAPGILGLFWKLLLQKRHFWCNTSRSFYCPGGGSHFHLISFRLRD